jgi:hypothetical protein
VRGHGLEQGGIDFCGTVGAGHAITLKLSGLIC